ncbi:MAG: CHAT domain-containing protein [Thermoanaerobaculia bacterium]
MGVIYEDFSIWIEPSREGAGYQVRAHCKAGEGSAAFEPPADLGDLFRSLLQTRDLGAKGDSGAGREVPRQAREIGGRLFQALFSGTVRQLYDRSLGAAPDPRRGLRLRFHLDPRLAPEVFELPWELLYCPESRDHFGLNRLSPVVRYIELPRATAAPNFEPPLRVLLAAASANSHGALDLSREIESIQKELGDTETKVTILEQVRLESLRTAMLRDSCHVLHFMGHGSFDPDTGTGVLLLESDDGREVRVSGEMLTDHLRDCPPHLAVINACNSGRMDSRTGHDLFAGVASALVLGGLPAVVAMRRPITDRAAIAFSKALYRELAAGEPVDAAVAEGRLAIYRADYSSPEWATPVLFMRLQDGSLFRRQGAEAAIPPASVGGTQNTINSTIHSKYIVNFNQQGRT